MALLPAASPLLGRFWGFLRHPRRDAFHQHQQQLHGTGVERDVSVGNSAVPLLKRLHTGQAGGGPILSLALSPRVDDECSAGGHLYFAVPAIESAIAFSHRHGLLLDIGENTVLKDPSR